MSGAWWRREKQGVEGWNKKRETARHISLCVGVLWQVFEEAKRKLMMRRACHILTTTFPCLTLLSQSVHFPTHSSLSHTVSVALSLSLSIPLPPPAVLRQSDASALQCNLWPWSSFLRANQLDVVLRAEQWNGPPPAACLLNKSPLPSHGPRPPVYGTHNTEPLNQNSQMKYVPPHVPVCRCMACCCPTCTAQGKLESGQGVRREVTNWIISHQHHPNYSVSILSNLGVQCPPQNFSLLS